MIAKIRRGAKIGGLMVYLLGEGEHNEHRDRHIIAGSPTVMRAQYLQHFDGPGDNEASRETALAVAHVIDVPRKLYGTQVKMRAKPVAVSVGASGRELGLDVVEPARKGEKSEMRDAPVWHCVLSLMPGEELDDKKWAQVTTEFMTRMGFVGTKDGYVAHARWAAVRHGHSGEHGDGQDHVHIAASLVREDGRKVSTYDYGPGRAKGDWKRADEVCGELEREFGLQILASRHEGGGLSGNSRAEYERAKRTNAPETERERLRRAVRAHATAAESEADFVLRLREAGIAVAPRWGTGGRTTVTGYKVRWRQGGEEVGPWVGGGKLANDLSLTALREQQWDDSPEAREAALAVWKGRAERGAKTNRVGGENTQEAWQRAATEAGHWRERLGQVPYGDRAQWAWMAGQAAGVFAAWSEVLEGDKPGAFAAAAQELTRSAQVRYSADRYKPPPRSRDSNLFGDVARLILTESARAGRPRSHHSEVEDVAAQIAVVILALMLLLLLLALAIAVEVARAHRARGELGRAVAVEHMTHQHLGPVRRDWEAELDERRYQWDRDAAEVFTAAAGRAAERNIDPEPATATATASGAGEQSPPTATTPRAKPTPAESVVAAASGPLTPPKPPAPDAPLRVYYSEMTEEQKAHHRIATGVWASSSAYDLRPRQWSEADLAAELAHRRTEIRLLAEDLAERGGAEGGPHTRQARADNAELTRQAAHIPAAQQAQKELEAAQREVNRLTAARERLELEHENTPKRRMLARAKLTADIGKIDAELAERTPGLPDLQAAAEATAQATGIPDSDWHEVMGEASDTRQRMRLATAHAQDASDLNEDSSYLRSLQRDLDKVEAEHNRREGLTPEQRESEARDRTRPRSPGPTNAPSTKPSRGVDMGYRPDRSRKPDQGIGM